MTITQQVKLFEAIEACVRYRRQQETYGRALLLAAVQDLAAWSILPAFPSATQIDHAIQEVRR